MLPIRKFEKAVCAKELLQVGMSRVDKDGTLLGSRELDGSIVGITEELGAGLFEGPLEGKLLG